MAATSSLNKMTLSLTDFLAMAGVAAPVVLAGFTYSRKRTAALAKALAASVDRIRTNDLAHMDEKMDRNYEATTAVSEKLDRHIEWHLGKHDGGI
jgi:hypothetical protein